MIAGKIKYIVLAILLLAFWLPYYTDIPKKTSAPEITQPANKELVFEKLGIKITNPATQDQTITSPIEITGYARGKWYFEAQFPIFIEVNGKTVGQTIATAQGDWMTSEYVPFKATLDFSDIKNLKNDTKAKLLFKNANPSGLAEHDIEVVIDVVLNPR